MVWTGRPGVLWFVWSQRVGHDWATELNWTEMSRECTFLDSLSHHNKDLEWWTLKPPQHVTALRSWIDHVIALRSWVDRVIALRQICITAQCYSSILFRRWQENPSSKREGMSIYRHEEKSAPACGGERERERERARERERERERERAGSGSSIYMFISPCACPM